WPNARQLQKFVVIAWNFSVVLFHNHASSGHEISSTTVITESRPQREHALFIGVRELRDRRKLSHESFVIRQSRFDLCLLEHDLGNPHGIRIVGDAPRQRPLVFVKPADELLEHWSLLVAARYRGSRFAHLFFDLLDFNEMSWIERKRGI